MSRIDVDRIVSAARDPWALVCLLGLERGAKRGSSYVTIACPFHDEKTPSCTVAVGPSGTVRVHCFGCSTTTDVLGLVAAVEHLDPKRDFRKVAERAAELLGAEVSETETGRPARSDGPRDLTPPERVPLDLGGKFGGELSGVLVGLHQDGAEDVTMPVRAYLDARGILGEVDGELLALDLEELVYRVEERIALGGDPDAGELGRAGLCRNGRPMWPTHTLAIVWRNPDASVDTLQRRRLDAGEPKYVFPSGRAPRWPYGVERLDGTTIDAPVTLCEGALDALVLRAMRAPGVVLGLPGVSTWRPWWSSLVRGRRVVLALDGDDAGDAATGRLAPLLSAAGATQLDRARPRRARDWAATRGAS